jgi:hypothetical protein
VLSGEVCNNCLGTRDIIDVEVISMSLTDGVNTLYAGKGVIPPGVTLWPSQGVISQTETDGTQANSFFKMNVQIDRGAPPNRYLYTQGPIRVEAVIDRVPPHDNYVQLNVNAGLFTDPDPTPPNTEVARVVTVQHKTFPVGGPTGACCLPDKCDNNTDDDGDGKVNDGCPQVGAAPEAGAQCDNNVDDDADGKVNDGCPQVGAAPENGCALNVTQDACVKLGGRYLGDGTTSCPPHDAAGDCIPTVSEWGLVVMAMLVLTAATVVIVRRRAMVHGGS